MNIPEIPPYPVRHSISLYSLSDALRPDELERVALIPERQPNQGSSSSFIPEALPVPFERQISLFSFDDLPEPIPQMDDSSQRFDITLDQPPPLIGVNNPEDKTAGSTKLKLIAGNSATVQSISLHKLSSDCWRGRRHPLIV